MAQLARDIYLPHNTFMDIRNWQDEWYPEYVSYKQIEHEWVTYDQIDTVWYNEDIDNEDVIKSLIDHDWYPSDIKIIVPCMYCDSGKSSHFECELCLGGMCDECYDLITEHDQHFHRICETCDDIQYERITTKLWHEPDYICEWCLSIILNPQD